MTDEQDRSLYACIADSVTEAIVARDYDLARERCQRLYVLLLNMVDPKLETIEGTVTAAKDD